MLDLREERMGDHMLKMHVEGLPRAAVFHHFTAPDGGPPHDHPFSFVSTIIAGGYVEEVFALDGTSRTVGRKPGDSFTVEAGHIHRIIALPTGECWTLILPGQHERTPGFYEWRDGQPWHRFWNGDWQPVTVNDVAAE